MCKLNLSYVSEDEKYLIKALGNDRTKKITIFETF